MVSATVDFHPPFPFLPKTLSSAHLSAPSALVKTMTLRHGRLSLPHLRPAVFCKTQDGRGLCVFETR